MKLILKNVIAEFNEIKSATLRGDIKSDCDWYINSLRKSYGPDDELNEEDTYNINLVLNSMKVYRG